MYLQCFCLATNFLARSCMLMEAIQSSPVSQVSQRDCREEGL